jgi:hypothetical protein
MAQKAQQGHRLRTFGPIVVGVVAIAASLPGLALPFMSDDWINLATVSDRLPLRTPFGYFRPLYLASYWAELHLWGMRSAAFHLTNTVLIAACAVMIVLVVRRFTGDPVWATAAGILFALHPFHVENAAWIAARADAASTAFVLVSLLAYESWTRQERGLPYAALLAFEAALLFKESVVLFPVMVIILRVVHTGSRLERREILRGILPLGCIAAIHFVVLRRIFLGDSGLDPLKTLGPYWIKRGVDFFSAAILPIHAERIEARPILVAGMALAILGVLVLLARRDLVSRTHQSGALALLFLASVAPSLLSFQERYFLFPSAVSCTILAYLLIRCPKRIAPVLWIFVMVVWFGSLGAHWYGWLEAGRVSDRLIAGLTEASHRDNVREIVIANQPYRVAGAPLAGDLSSAVSLSGGRVVRVRAATSLNLPTAEESGIEGPLSGAVRRLPNGVELRVHMPEGMFSGIFLPLKRPPNTIHEEDYATLEYDDLNGVVVRIPRLDDGSRAAYVWYKGELTELF